MADNGNDEEKKSEKAKVVRVKMLMGKDRKEKD